MRNYKIVAFSFISEMYLLDIFRGPKIFTSTLRGICCKCNKNRLYQLIPVINNVIQKVAGKNDLNDFKLNDFEIKYLIMENNAVYRWLQFSCY